MAEEARTQLVRVGRRLAQEGLVPGSSGNLSVAIAEGLLVTPTGSRLSDLNPHALALVDADGAQTAGPLAPSSELALHLAAHRRDDVGAVIHTHAPMATVLGCVLQELPLIHYAMLELGGRVRVARQATFGTERLAEVTAEALEGRSAALMANHGAVVLGPDLATALERTLLLEWLCSLLWHALAIGSPRELTEAEQRAAQLRLAQGTTELQTEGWGG